MQRKNFQIGNNQNVLLKVPSTYIVIVHHSTHEDQEQVIIITRLLASGFVHPAVVVTGSLQLEYLQLWGILARLQLKVTGT